MCKAGINHSTPPPEAGLLPRLRLQLDWQHQRRVPRMRDADCRKGWGMKRKLFNFAALLSFLLCLTIVTLWGFGAGSSYSDERLFYQVYTYPYGWMAQVEAHTSFPLPTWNVGDTN